MTASHMGGPNWVGESPSGLRGWTREMSEVPPPFIRSFGTESEAHGLLEVRCCMKRVQHMEKPSIHQVTSSSAAPLRGLRQLVSGSKQRFQREGFDLDLTYVLPRVIALGLPASSALEQMYRNPITEVRDFLNRYHTSSYALVNLCDERDYSDDEFPGATLMRFPFPDHHPPCLAALISFCQSVHKYLRNEENVIAVHCKAGKGRTGVIVSALHSATRMP